VAMYFKRQVELSTMYRTMEEHNYDTPEDAILAVKSRSVLGIYQISGTILSQPHIRPLFAIRFRLRPVKKLDNETG